MELDFLDWAPFSIWLSYSQRQITHDAEFSPRVKLAQPNRKQWAKNVLQKQKNVPTRIWLNPNRNNYKQNSRNFRQKMTQS